MALHVRGSASVHFAGTGYQILGNAGVPQTVDPTPSFRSFSSTDPSRLLRPDGQPVQQPGDPIATWVSDQGPAFVLAASGDRLFNPAGFLSPSWTTSPDGPVVLGSTRGYFEEQPQPDGSYPLGGNGRAIFLVFQAFDSTYVQRPILCKQAAPSNAATIRPDGFELQHPNFDALGPTGGAVAFQHIVETSLPVTSVAARLGASGSRPGPSAQTACPAISAWSWGFKLSPAVGRAPITPSSASSALAWVRSTPL